MLIVIFLAPFLVIWNVLISDNFIGYVNGGFGISYTRRVTWVGSDPIFILLH